MKRKNLLLLLFVLISISLHAGVYSTTGSQRSLNVVISKKTNKPPRLSEPIATYNIDNHYLNIDFGDQPIEDYTVTISSPFTDVDYYVTSSYTTIPLLVDGYSDYTIIIETCDGDVFEGTLAASDYTTTATI